MEVNELRIGNYLFIDVGLPSMETHAVKAEDITSISNNVMKILVKPIPLTEEWLLKFGFEYKDRGGYKGWYSPFVLNESIRIFEIENGWFKYSSARSVIKYVHQLQNLYFALTGEELTIKS